MAEKTTPVRKLARSPATPKAAKVVPRKAATSIDKDRLLRATGTGVKVNPPRPQPPGWRPGTGVAKPGRG